MQTTYRYGNGWTLEITGYRALHAEFTSYLEDYGEGYMAQGTLSKGGVVLKVDGFAHKTLERAYQGLAELAESDGDLYDRTHP